MLAEIICVGVGVGGCGLGLLLAETGCGMAAAVGNKCEARTMEELLALLVAGVKAGRHLAERETTRSPGTSVIEELERRF